MIALLKSLFTGQSAAIAGVLVAFNVALSGLSKFIESFMDKTATDVDNKVDSFLQKALVVVQKVIDFCMGNPEHK